MEKVEPYRDYQRTVYMALVIGCLMSLLLFVGPYILIGTINGNDAGHNYLLQNNWLGTLGGVGVFLLIAEAIGVMVYDWRGAVTLRGAIKRQTIPTGYKGKQANTTLVFLLLYVFMPEIMVPIYLAYVGVDLHRRKQLQQIELRQQIAVMEAQLGILPAAEGTCRSCGKPLQVGAEFCSYCGDSVLERPKICPSCATTTFSDAKWCPNCRTAL